MPGMWSRLQALRSPAGEALATSGHLPISAILHAEPPRSECREHGVKAVKLSWAEPSSRFTVRFKGLAFEWLKAGAVRRKN